MRGWMMAGFLFLSDLFQQSSIHKLFFSRSVTVLSCKSHIWTVWKWIRYCGGFCILYEESLLKSWGFDARKKYILLSEITQSRDLHPLIYSSSPKACSIHFLYHYCLTLLDVPLVCFREADRRPPYMLKKRHHHICLSHVSTGCAVSAQNVCLHILFSCWPLHKQIHVYNSRITWCITCYIHIDYTWLINISTV